MMIREIVLIAGMASVTFAIRYILLAFANKFTLPDLMKDALGFVPPAVLTAIVVPAVLSPAGTIDVSLANPYLIAALAAVLCGGIIRKHSLWAAIVSGLIVFFLLRLVFHI